MRPITRTALGLTTILLMLSLAPTAQAQPPPSDLVPIAASDIPRSVCNYYSLQKLPSWPSMPFNWLNSEANVQLYVSPSLGLNVIFVGDQDIDYAQRAAQAQVSRMARRAAANDGPPGPGDDGNGGEDPGVDWSGGPWPYGTNDFWLEAVSLGTNLFNVILHGTTNGSTYLILSTESPNLQANSTWLIEGSLQGGTNDGTPFALGIATRTNSLFIRAQACDECATTALPLWWQLAYFGVTGVDPNGDHDGDGISNLDAYLNGTDPNKIKFSLSVTNQYVTGNSTPLQLHIASGWPSYIAVLVNSTNGSWEPFTATNLSVPTPTDGVYVVNVGLCGLAPTATQTWQSVTLFRDTTPLTLGLTNPAALSGSRPFIDPAGYATRSLSAITWTVVDANGGTNTGSGTLVAQDWNRLEQYHTTNWFQCLDLALALGTNWISIQAADWAGTVAVTNFTYVFDTNGDTIAPAVTLVWPQDGTLASGDNLTVHAWMDDDTAAVALQYTNSDGILQTVNALVERGGNVWVRNVPLIAGTNSFTFAATDAAGNVSITNFSVVQSSVALTVTPLSQDQMQYGYARVTGSVGDSACTVAVNGVQGTNYGDGTWAVDNVPLAVGGAIALLTTAGLPGGVSLQTLLEQDREPIVFTQSYGLGQDYTYICEMSNGVGQATFTGEHIMDWTRGAGGTSSKLATEVCAAGVITMETVTVWPADNGYIPSLPGQEVRNWYFNGVLWDTSTSTVNAPSVEWMEQSTAGGQCPAGYVGTYSASSSRQVKLFTGGSAARQRLGLFNLSAHLAVESTPFGSVESWNGLGDFQPFLLSDVPPVSVASEQISLGGLGKLDSGGDLATLQLDGLELVATPEVVSSTSARAAASSPAAGGSAGASHTGALPSKEKYRLVSETVCTLANDPARLCLGVAERVKISLAPELSWPGYMDVTWRTSAGSVSPWFGNGTLLTAPSNTATATVTMGYKAVRWPITFDVREPSGVKATLRGPPEAFAPGSVGAGMYIDVVLQPTNVSFRWVQIEEPVASATGRTGYFIDHAPPDHDLAHGAGVWHPVLCNNLVSDDAFDHAWSAGWPIGQEGSNTWPIKPLWRIADDTKTHSLSGWTDQVHTLYSDGTMKVEKLGHTVTRHTYESTGTAQ
jgi:hypothetical protein